MGTRLDWSDQADPEWMARALGDWRKRSGPLYKRLADEMRGVIAGGDLPPGARLAPERDLAMALGVSRSTVIGCYETLEREGRLERRQGSGTRVRGNDGSAAVTPFVDRKSRIHPRAGEQVVDLTVAGPDISDPVREASRMALDRFADADLGHGYRSQGLHALRVAVAEHLSKGGVPTSPEEILIAAGAHQAMALLFASDVRPGEVVATEDPTYAGVIDLIEHTGARTFGMAIDREGVRPEALEAAARRGARLVHMVPTGQNPSGAVMSRQRRKDLGLLAARLGVTILEDTVFEDVTRDGVRLPSIASLGTGANIITVGSVSKLFWGGLRTGWVRAPAPVIDRLVRLKMLLDHGSPITAQGAALFLLDRFEAQREFMRGHLEQVIAVIEAALEEGPLTAWSWQPPAAGISAWLRMPVPEATRFSRFARSMGVAVVPGSACSPRGAFEDHVRVSLGPSPVTLAAGMERLGAAWAAFSPEAQPEPEIAHALV
jgi:DNA-binding transcriptional MocR family regulator